MTITRTPVSQSDDYLLYPNPVSNDLFIQFDIEKKGIFHISDMTGKVLISNKFEQQRNISINVVSLYSGVYICTYVDMEGRQISKKFVKVE